MESSGRRSGGCERRCVRGADPPSFFIKTRGCGSSKVTNAKGLKCVVLAVCCWGVGGVLLLISWISMFQAEKISQLDHCFFCMSVIQNQNET
jgi:hypothetical protein